jgi:nucleotide-binding universal stress UspA family protein
MSRVSQPVIVVGVSGSAASAAALRWAADEARQRGARLRAVCAWSPEFRAPYAPVAGRATPARQRASAAACLTAAVRALGAARPADLVAEVTQGIAERTLVARSAGADLLVLGSAAPPGTSARSVGLVVRSCLSRSRCPVVVVSPDETAARPAPARVPTWARDLTERRRPAHAVPELVSPDGAGRRSRPTVTFRHGPPSLAGLRWAVTRRSGERWMR